MAEAQERFGPGSPETVASAALGVHLGVVLRPERLVLGDGTTVEVEGVADDGSVIAQFVMNSGAMRSGFRNKVTADLFKLVWVRRVRFPHARALLCVSAAVAPVFTPRGWLTAAARDLDLAVYVVGEDSSVAPLNVTSAKHR